MVSRLFMLFALMVVIAAAWAALVTLLLPPLNPWLARVLGGDGQAVGTERRRPRGRHSLVFGLSLLFLALRCSFSNRSCAAV